MDIRTSLAATNYAKAREVAEPSGEGDSFSDRVSAAAQDFLSTLERADQTAQDAMTGKADPHTMVEALAQAQLAMETAVTIRDKVVEAYQEILRMPV